MINTIPTYYISKPPYEWNSFDMAARLYIHWRDSEATYHKDSIPAWVMRKRMMELHAIACVELMKDKEYMNRINYYE